MRLWEEDSVLKENALPSVKAHTTFLSPKHAAMVLTLEIKPKVLPPYPTDRTRYAPDPR